LTGSDALTKARPLRHPVVPHLDVKVGIMARKASKLFSLSALPKTLPDDLEIVEVKRTIRGDKAKGEDGKETTPTVEMVLPFVVPQSTGAGALAYSKFYHEAGAGDGGAFLAQAARSAIPAIISRYLKPEDAQKRSTLILPPIPTLRVVDKAEAAGEIVSKAIAESVRSGKKLTAKELLDLYSSATG
jgi:hypothetical protein